MKRVIFYCDTRSLVGCPTGFKEAADDRQPPEGLELEELEEWEKNNLPYREMWRRNEVRLDLRIEEREEAHRDWLDDFREKNGRIASLQEDVFSFSDGLESLTNGLVPRNQRQ